MKGLKRVSNGSASIYNDISMHCFHTHTRAGTGGTYHSLQRLLTLLVARLGFVSRLALLALWRHAVRSELCVGGAGCVVSGWDVFRRQNWTMTQERPRERRTKAVRHRPRRSRKRFKVKVGLAGLPQGPFAWVSVQEAFPWLSHGPWRPRTAGPAVWTTILNACCNDSPPTRIAPKNGQQTCQSSGSCKTGHGKQSHARVPHPAVHG